MKDKRTNSFWNKCYMLKLTTDKIRLSLRINNVFNRDSYILELELEIMSPYCINSNRCKNPKENISINSIIKHNRFISKIFEQFRM